MRTDRKTGGQPDMKKHIFSFPSFAKAPKKDFGNGETLDADSKVQSRTVHAGSLELSLKVYSIARAERDGTRAETRFRLSPKRTSPFKSVGASVQSTACSRVVRISLSNAG